MVSSNWESVISKGFSVWHWHRNNVEF